jgi:MFS family permease
MPKEILSKNERIIEKEKSRKLSIWEAGAFSIGDGFGLRNITPYALALNAPNSLIGLLTSIPSLFGNVAQLASYKLLKIHSRKKLVIWAVFLQTIFWLMLLIPGILFLKQISLSNKPIIILIAVYTGLVVSGTMAGPAWNSWMKDLVPKKELGKYFAKRSKIAGTVAFVCMIIGGLILDYFRQINVIYGFLILFIIASFFRLVSGVLSTKQYEPKLKGKKNSYFSLYNFIKNIPFNNFGRFVLFIALINFSVAISSPFLAVYLLKNKDFTYTMYVILTMLMPLAGIATMNYWGRISDRFGNVKIMKMASIAIIIIPFAYFLSNYMNNTLWILIVLIPIEIMGGIGWGGFNLAASNFLFKTVSLEKMILCTSYMNVINGVSIFLGASIGGLLTTISHWNPILLVFLISGFCRWIVYLLVLPKMTEKNTKNSNYELGNTNTYLVLAQRFIYNNGDLIYFKEKLDSIKKLKLFNTF